MFPFL